MNIIQQKDAELSQPQKEQIEEFIIKCFGPGIEEKRRDWYFSPTHVHLMLYENDELVAYTRTIIRETTYADEPLKIGGIGDVCVHPSQRGKGVGTEMARQAMEILKAEGCDIALLQTDCSQRGKLYSRVGFTQLHKSYTFHDIDDVLRKTDADDVMVAPVMNEKKVKQLFDSTQILHVGKGDW
ncbi:MAG: GNAT family N-acetyltransferase [Weeksellaceae bacterium]